MTQRQKRPLQAAAHARNREFLRLFAEVEQALKRRVKGRAGDRPKFHELLKLYLDLNPYWKDAAEELRLCADVRNLITHEQRTATGDPAFVSPALFAKCRLIHDDLIRPRPVSDVFGTTVTCMQLDATLADVLLTAHKKKYSQFPVMKGDHFKGLITEKGITKWLGRRVADDGRLPDLDTATVLSVLKQQPRDTSILDWARADAPVDEVMARFCHPKRAELEVVLLTHNGGQGRPCGIVTTWDAARYVPELQHARVPR